jgi:hypothetical protein
VGQGRDFSIQFQQKGGVKVDIFWDDGKDGNMVAVINPDDVVAARTYEGHTFFVTPHGKTKPRLGVMKMKADEDARRYMFTAGKTAADFKVDTAKDLIKEVGRPAKFRNRRDEPVDMYYVDHSGQPIYQGTVHSKETDCQHVYTTHRFFFAKHKSGKFTKIRVEVLH